MSNSTPLASRPERASQTPERSAVLRAGTKSGIAKSAAGAKSAPGTKSPGMPNGTWPDQSGCPVHDLRRKLRQAGLRPTRQRVGLGWLLFAKGDRHVTAELLYDEAARARVPVSLATIYNTLHQFTQAGLLREVAVDGAKTYFDTNVSDHHHFFIEGDNVLQDIAGASVQVASIPEPPDGMEVARVDVIVRLRKKS